MPGSRDDQGGTARDSLVVGAGTAVSRLSGVLRVVVVGAVLGPTTFGNTFQLTNSLPNLIYYGFLAGSLFASLLMPVLVRHVDSGDAGRTARVSGGFLGTSWLAMLVIVPVAVLVVPEVVGLLAPASAATGTADARLLLLLTCPQVFLYALAGSAGAVLNAHRRFALAAVAPAVENVGVIAVLVVVWVRYGSVSEGSGSPPTGEVLLLGLGSTAAVAAHAALQWWGARSQGVAVVPRAGWRDPEVRVVVRRAVRSVLQAGLLALQMLVLLLLAGRVAGGTVALQMVFNFYYLPIALVATPVGLALLPRLSRLHRAGAVEVFRDRFVEGLGLALFLAVPAAVGYVLLAGPVAHAITVGAMSSGEGVAMVAGALAAIAPGLIGQTTFFVATQAAYARQDTRTPLRSMAWQAAVCIAAATGALLVQGAGSVVVLALAYAAAALVGGAHLVAAVARSCDLPARELAPLLRRPVLGALAMAAPVWAVVQLAVAAVGERSGWILAAVLGSVVGAATYLASQHLLHSPELSALRRAVRRAPAVEALPGEVAR